MDKQTTKHLEEFLLDDSFKEFVTGENNESVEKWNLWIANNPQVGKEFETAIKVMNLLLKTQKDILGLNTEKDLETLLQAIRNEKEDGESRNNKKLYWWRLTAIITLLVSACSLLFFIGKGNPESFLVYNEVIVPLGEKSQLVLADGTHIWLNSSSKLRYPSRFNNHERTVYLEGEAFFDVTKSEKQSFVVNTPDLKVKVLGTAFNVKNYPGDKNAVTTVIRGLVRVESLKEHSGVLLNPNENYVLNTNPGKNLTKPDKSSEGETSLVPVKIQPIVNKMVNVEAITSWKDQMLVFVDEPLEDVALKMGRWYNVKIYILNDELKKIRYRGKFVNNETIYQVLEAIKFTTPIKYKVKNNDIYIDKPN